MPKQADIRIRKGTASEWSNANPTLAQGEMAIETDTRKVKVGNGSAAWNSLQYVRFDGGDMDSQVASRQTAVGSDVQVEAFAQSGANIGVGLNFSSIQGSGTTTVIKLTSPGNPSLPANFSLNNSLGSYNINTTATFSGNVFVKFVLPSNVTQQVFDSVRIFKLTSGVTTDVTVLNGQYAPNFATKTLYASVTSFSEFYVIPSVAPNTTTTAAPTTTTTTTTTTAAPTTTTTAAPTTTTTAAPTVSLSAPYGAVTGSGTVASKWTWQSGSGFSEGTSAKLLTASGAVMLRAILTSTGGGNCDYGEERSLGIYSAANTRLRAMPANMTASLNSGEYVMLELSCAHARAEIYVVDGKPDAPTGLIGLSGGNAKATLSWTSPSDPGASAITNYSAEYTPAGGSPLTTLLNSTSTSSIFLSGLTNGTTYSIRVAAVNSFGVGAYSSSVSITPQDGPPVSLSIPYGLITGSGTVASKWRWQSGSGFSMGTGAKLLTADSSVTLQAILTNTGGGNCDGGEERNLGIYSASNVRVRTMSANPESLTAGQYIFMELDCAQGRAEVWDPTATTTAPTTTTTTAAPTTTTTTAAPTTTTTTAAPAASVPGVPTSVRNGNPYWACDDGANWIIWNVPSSDGGSAVTGYVWRIGSGSTTSVSPSPGTNGNLFSNQSWTGGRVQGLPTGGSFQVAAVNAIGTGPFASISLQQDCN